MIEDFIVSIGWVLLVIALVWAMLKPTLVSVLVLVATLCLVGFMIEALE